MFKIVLVDTEFGAVPLDAVGEFDPIFARLNGQLMGMVTNVKDKGWILALGGDCGATGYHNTRRECIVSCLKLGYDFVIDTE